MVVNGVSPVGYDDNSAYPAAAAGNSNQPEDPGSFRLMIEQMTNSNLNQLFSLSRSIDGSNDSGGDDIFGGGSSFSGFGDPLAPFSVQSSADPFSSIMSSTQSLGGFDPTLLSPNAGMDQYKMNSTLQKLAYYTDVTETLRWRNATISYDDPATGLAKKGLVKEVYIQNVNEPQFVLENGDTINFSEVKSILGSELAANNNQAEEQEQKEA